MIDLRSLHGLSNPDALGYMLRCAVSCRGRRRKRRDTCSALARPSLPQAARLLPSTLRLHLWACPSWPAKTYRGKTRFARGVQFLQYYQIQLALHSSHIVGLPRSRGLRCESCCWSGKRLLSLLWTSQRRKTPRESCFGVAL